MSWTILSCTLGAIAACLAAGFWFWLGRLVVRWAARVADALEEMDCDF